MYSVRLIHLNSVNKVEVTLIGKRITRVTALDQITRRHKAGMSKCRVLNHNFLSRSSVKGYV